MITTVDVNRYVEQRLNRSRPSQSIRKSFFSNSPRTSRYTRGIAAAEFCGEPTFRPNV